MELVKKVLITIGRERGSKGRDIGVALSKDLNIPLFDHNMLSIVAKQHGYNEDALSGQDEKLTNPFFEPYTQYGMDNSLAEKLFILQSRIIREQADKGSAIFIGRCADDVLADRPDLLNIFVYAPLQDRIKRVTEKDGLSESEAEKLIKKVDKQRRSYYQFYTDKKWGSTEGMAMLLNSVALTPEGCVAIIEGYLKNKGYLQ